MSDQFFEWDQFYNLYERSLTPLNAMKRYKKRRKSMDQRRERIAKLESIIARRRASSSATRERSAEDESSGIATSSGCAGTKNG